MGLAFDEGATQGAEGLLLFADESRFILPNFEVDPVTGEREFLGVRMVRSRLEASSRLIRGDVQLSLFDSDGDGLSEVVGSVVEGNQFNFVRVNRGFRVSGN